MKSRSAILVLVAALVLFVTNSAMALYFSEPQVLDDWPDNVISGDYSSQVSGTQMQMSVVGADGNRAYGDRRMAFTDSVGAMATYNVSSVEGDNVNMGMSQIIGYTSTGTWILATIELDTFAGDNRIRYLVREYDPSTSQTIKTWSVGNLGGYSGGWKINENVTIAFGRIGTQIYFYSPSMDVFAIIQPLDFAGFLSGPVILFGWTDTKSGNSMTATISNVMILYP